MQYTVPFPLYTQIQNYNTDSPMLPATAPSSKFQTKLNENESKIPYNALNRYSSSGSYATYNDLPIAEPPYVVYKSPDGNKVRDFTGVNIEVTTPKPQNCPVENIPIIENFASPEKIRNLEIILFIDPKCQYSKKQLNMDFSNHCKILNIKKKENKQLFTDHGGFATPYFFSTKTNRAYTGFIDSAQKLSKAMRVQENFTTTSTTSTDHSKRLKDLDITVYSFHGCPHCDNFKKLLHENKLMDSVQIEENISNMKNVEDIRGWPTICSKKTGKRMTGAPFTIDALIGYLS